MHLLYINIIVYNGLHWYTNHYNHYNYTEIVHFLLYRSTMKHDTIYLLLIPHSFSTSMPTMILIVISAPRIQVQSNAKMHVGGAPCSSQATSGVLLSRVVSSPEMNSFSNFFTRVNTTVNHEF